MQLELEFDALALLILTLRPGAPQVAGPTMLGAAVAKGRDEEDEARSVRSWRGRAPRAGPRIGGVVEHGVSC